MTAADGKQSKAAAAKRRQAYLKRRDKARSTYLARGLFLGVALGLAAGGLVLHDWVLGMLAGMLVGTLAGVLIKKRR